MMITSNMMKGEIIDEDLVVRNPHEMDTFTTLNSKFRRGLTVVKFLRRFGCPLTRYEALALSQHKSEFDKLDVNLVAVGFDTTGIEDFIYGEYWNGELYADPSLELYKKFNLNRTSKLQNFKGMLSPQTRRMFKRAKSEVCGNSQGDKCQLGGTFVIDSEGEILYSYIQNHISRFPTVNEILDICRNKVEMEKELDISRQIEEEAFFEDLDAEERISIMTRLTGFDMLGKPEYHQYEDSDDYEFSSLSSCDS